MKIPLKIRLKKQYIFISARGCQMDPEIDEKGGPIKSINSQLRAQKHENLRHFRESIAKFIEKTRVFDVPGPPRPLSTSKEPSGPQFGHKMDPHGVLKPEKMRYVRSPIGKNLEKIHIFSRFWLIGLRKYRIFSGFRAPGGPFYDQIVVQMTLWTFRGA